MRNIQPRTIALTFLALMIVYAVLERFVIHPDIDIRGSAKNKAVLPFSPTPKPSPAATVAKTETTTPYTVEAEKPSSKDTFRASLQTCAPDIAAQGIGTPEALMEYLKKSVGVAKEEVDVQNYHITLPDNSERRIQVRLTDAGKKELLFFKLDAQGYPEQLPINGDETLESLLSQGHLVRKEVKANWSLKDKTHVTLQTHDDRIFEFQYMGHQKVLSCRYTDCQCP